MESFLTFATDPRVICWTLAAFTFGGLFGMYLEAYRLTIERMNHDDYLSTDHVAPRRHLSGKGEAADCADELPSDGCCADVAARLRQVGGA